MESPDNVPSDDSEDDNSENSLKIVLETPTNRKKFVPDETDKQIIEAVEDTIEQCLEEKAAKVNFKINHVKHILKHVVTNEHVLALVRQAENPEEVDENITVYEPKLTRAKAKELLPNVPNSLLVPPIPPTTTKSQTHVLISDDLQEDSSDDEYVPGEEESEDDRDSSVVSDGDPLSVPPMTPPTPVANDVQETTYTEDGIFKIPQTKNKGETEEPDATIALRTRSKLSLSSTPLEVIEEQFIPPDITTDMYDMDCDDEDWTDFLKKFTRPLDEINKALEDEDHDPEYNILADEEIDRVDREDFRVDRAVKVSRKELNDLMVELFAFTDIYSKDEKNNQENINSVTTPVPELAISESAGTVTSIQEPPEDIMIEQQQVLLLGQQLRQHVQLLTQYFLLTYKHPEVHDYSCEAKEFLLNMKYLGVGKQKTMFNIINLQGAMKLICDWEQLLATNSDDVKEMKKHVQNDIAESLRKKKIETPYVCTLAPLIMETISKSDVFIYTFLLPKLPFKSITYYSPRHVTFFDSEDSLIAMGLEQFTHMIEENNEIIVPKSGDRLLKILSKYIHEFMVPTKTSDQIFTHIKTCRQSRCASNPIKTFHQSKKITPFVHCLYSLDSLKIVPPCQRRPEDLPHQIRHHVYKYLNGTLNMTYNGNISTLSLTPVFNLLQTQTLSSNRILLPKWQNSNSVLSKGPITSTPINPRINRRSKKVSLNRTQLNKTAQSTVNVSSNSCCQNSRILTPLENIIRIFKKSSPSEEILQLFQKDIENIVPNKLPQKVLNKSNSLPKRVSEIEMLPSMPNLNTPIKKDDRVSSTTDDVNISKEDILKEQVPDLNIDRVEAESSGITNDDKSETKDSNHTQNCDSTRTSEEMSENNVEKDNLDDINALMIASSTVKPNTKKEPSGAEKKRAKTKREFLANLAICTPEDPEVELAKSESFALAYYDKLRETLELEHYHQIMQILNESDIQNAVELYRKVEKVLRPNYNELADEFLLFLRDKEAAAIGKLIPWIQMNTRSKFLRKLEIYFKDQPAQLRKIFKCLTDLSDQVDVSMDKIKGTLLPMLKGNTHLVDLFLQTFLNETPPKSLMEGSFENIDINKEMSRPENEELYESIVIPHEDDVYGSSNCICTCHQIEDPEFKTRHRHCIPCGTKFIQGKVYIQTGRGLRPATVSFLTNSNKDHNIRLNGKTPASSRRKRSETSPSKQVIISPSKDNGDEESDDEVDGKKKIKTKTPRKRKKQPDKKTGKDLLKSGKNSDKTENGNQNDKPVRKRLIKKTSKDIKSPSEDAIQFNTLEESKTNGELDTKPGSSSGQFKRMADDNAEWEYVTSTESIEMKPASPGTQTAESESEFCEESSQDNCESDSNLSCSSGSNTQSDSNTGEDLCWRREEDKIILETFQKENDKEYAFTLIAKKLKDRTVSQIRSRFQMLMTLLMEQLK